MPYAYTPLSVCLSIRCTSAPGPATSAPQPGAPAYDAARVRRLRRALVQLNDGTLVLTVAPYYTCWEGEHVGIVVVAVMAIVAYVIGLPALTIVSTRCGLCACACALA